MFITTAANTALTAAQTAVINALTANRLTGDLTLAGDVLTVRGTFNPALLADNDGEGYLAWRNTTRASLQASIDGLGYEVMDVDYAGAASAGVWMATVQPMPVKMAKANKAAAKARTEQSAPKQPKATKQPVAKVMQVTVKAGVAYRAYRTGHSGFIQNASLADILGACEGFAISYTNFSGDAAAAQVATETKASHDLIALIEANDTPIVMLDPKKVAPLGAKKAKAAVTPAPKPEPKPLTATVTTVASNGGGTSYNVQLSNLKSTLRVEADDMDAKEAELVAAGYIVTYTNTAA